MKICTNFAQERNFRFKTGQDTLERRPCWAKNLHKTVVINKIPDNDLLFRNLPHLAIQIIIERRDQRAQSKQQKATNPCKLCIPHSEFTAVVDMFRKCRQYTHIND